MIFDIRISLNPSLISHYCLLLLVLYLFFFYNGIHFRTLGRVKYLFIYLFLKKKDLGASFLGHLAGL
jgi:hypothetical protein